MKTSFKKSLLILIPMVLLTAACGFSQVFGESEADDKPQVDVMPSQTPSAMPSSTPTVTPSATPTVTPSVTPTATLVAASIDYVASTWSRVYVGSSETDEIAPVMNFDEVVTDAYIQPTSWSPNGDAFIYLQRNEKGEQREHATLTAFVVKPATLTPQPLFEHRSCGFMDTIYWSSDGSKLIFSGVDGDLYYIAIYDFATAEVKRIFEEEGSCFDLIGWSEDETDVTFLSDMGRSFDFYIGEMGVYKLHIPTGEISTVFYDQSVGIYGAKMSPTDPGLMVLYANGPDVSYFKWNLMLVNTATGEIIDEVFEQDRNYPSYEFSPDGKTLFYSSYYEKQIELCFRDLEGRQETVCMTDPRFSRFAEIGSLSWFPDSSAIAIDFWFGGGLTREDCLGVIALNKSDLSVWTVIPDQKDSEFCACLLGEIAWRPSAR